MNEVNVEKIENSGKIDGSYYFFKVPNDANIKLVDSNRPLRINLNYNIMLKEIPDCICDLIHLKILKNEENISAI